MSKPKDCLQQLNKSQLKKTDELIIKFTTLMVGPLSYLGGKNRSARRIISLIPEHTAYIEPFCGGAQVFFHKTPSRVEVLNDLDEEVFNFLRVCQLHQGELVRYLQFSIASRKWFELFQKQDPKTLSDIQRAARFFYLQKNCYGGLIKRQHFAVSVQDGSNYNPHRIPMVLQGPEQEEIRRRFIEVRYSLLPYIYTSAEQTTHTGIPLMRPMFMEFPDDSALTTLDGQYMFGHDLLVAPKVVESTDPYNIVLPRGTWYDYWTGAKIDGGRSITVNPTLDELPVYVRAGAIIPHQPIVQNVDELPEGPLEIRVYPGPNCRGSIYMDDGNSFDFTRGAYLRMGLSCTPLADSALVHIDPAAGNFKPWWHQIRVVVVGIASAPREVKVNGVMTSDWKYADNSVSVMIPAPTSALDVAVSYK